MFFLWHKEKLKAGGLGIIGIIGTCEVRRLGISVLALLVKCNVVASISSLFGLEIVQAESNFTQ